MKKFFKNIAIFIAAILVIDVIAGTVLDTLKTSAKGGGIQKRYYIAKQCNEEILLFGSSRMAHHYVPQIFEDSLKMTCFNAGLDGNGIIFSYGQLKMLLKHNTPKLIIYDISGFDHDIDDNLKYIANLRAYCEDPDVMDIILQVDKSEKWKLLSNLYKYNSQCIQIIGTNISPISSFDKGYSPLHHTMDYVPETTIHKTTSSDSLKLKLVENFITDCKARNIKLVFMASPMYQSIKFDNIYPEIQRICKKHNIPFKDYINLPGISDNKSFFQDQTHLNHTGATIYTNHIISYLKSEIHCSEL